MGRLPAGATPSYRQHKPSGRAVVTLNDLGGQRRDIYLGQHGSAASHEAYAYWIGLWEANGRALPVESDEPPTVGKLCVKFLDHADLYYRKGGRRTSGYKNARWTVRVLSDQGYGQLLACEFDYPTFREFRDMLIASGVARETINDHCERVIRIFAWGARERLVDAETVADLRLMEPLKKGRTRAPDPEPVTPVEDAEVERIMPHLSPSVRAMVELQRLTGMRPGEVCRLRPIDLDRSDPDVWLYEDGGHKSAHLGKRRVIGIGPRARAVLRSHLDAQTDPAGYVFPPPKRSPRHRAGLPMTVDSYGEAIEAGWLKSRGVRITDWKPDPKAEDRERAAAVASAYRERVIAEHGRPWRPHRIRHSAATECRAEFGAEAAQLLLGHANLKTTEIYAERDVKRLKALARQFG